MWVKIRGRRIAIFKNHLFLSAMLAKKSNLINNDKFILRLKC